MASAIVVSVSCATLIVTVRLPVAPCCSGSGSGSSDTIAAGCGATCTAEVFDVLFASAVMSGVAGARAGGGEGGAGRALRDRHGCRHLSTGGLADESSISVFVVCAALMRTVKVLVARQRHGEGRGLE